MASKYKIIDGVEFKPYGEKSLITNEILSDAMAEMFIKKNPSLLGTIFEKVGEIKVKAKIKAAAKVKVKAKAKTKTKAKSKKK